MYSWSSIPLQECSRSVCSNQGGPCRVEGAIFSGEVHRRFDQGFSPERSSTCAKRCFAVSLSWHRGARTEERQRWFRIVSFSRWKGEHDEGPCVAPNEWQKYLSNLQGLGYWKGGGTLQNGVARGPPRALSGRARLESSTRLGTHPDCSHGASKESQKAWLGISDSTFISILPPKIKAAVTSTAASLFIALVFR